VTKKNTLKTSSEAKRDAIAEETETFLRAGHEINRIPYGVSGLDPMGRGKPTTHGQSKNRAAEAASGRDVSKIATRDSGLTD